MLVCWGREILEHLIRLLFHFQSTLSIPSSEIPMSLKVTTQSLFWPPVTEVENGEETRKPQNSFVRLNHVGDRSCSKEEYQFDCLPLISSHGLCLSVPLSCKQAIVNRRPTDSVRSCTTNWQLRHDQQRNQRADEQRKLASWKQRKEGRKGRYTHTLR